MKLFDKANRYCRESTWKTIAALKLCLFSMGIIVGVLLPDACRTPVLVIFGAVFVATYIPLMAKFVRILKKD